jgi:hypothetical protein
MHCDAPSKNYQITIDGKEENQIDATVTVY